MRKVLFLLLITSVPCFSQTVVGGGGKFGGGFTTYASGGSTATLIPCPTPQVSLQVGNNANCKQSATVAFGKQGTSTSSMVMTVTVNNCAPTSLSNSLYLNENCTSGSGSLTLSSPYYTITGTNASDFTNTGGGTCANGGSVATNSYCTILIQFTPTASSGTNETASLNIKSNAANGGTQTVSLTGTSATVTTLSACGTLSSGVNYQLTQNVSATGSCFTAGTITGTDLNLNGFTVTYCSSSSTSLVGGVLMTGNYTKQLTVHNGSIIEGSGNCTGLTASSLYGSGTVTPNNDGNTGATQGTTLFNLFMQQHEAQGKIFVELTINGAVTTGTTIHDVVYEDDDPGDCAVVSCRSQAQFSSFIIQGNPTVAPNLYNIQGTKGPQTALSVSAANPVITNNIVNLGNSGTNATVANGYVVQEWNGGGTVENNIGLGTGTGGAILSGRGIQLAVVGSSAVTGAVIQNNYMLTTVLDNDAEYTCTTSTSGTGATYAGQINNTGSSGDLSNNQFLGNYFVAYANVCAGVGFAYDTATHAAGINKTQGNVFGCHAGPSFSYVNNINFCTGVFLNDNEYNPQNDNSLQSTSDVIFGASSDLYMTSNGPWPCYSCTFQKPSDAIATFLFFDADSGNNCCNKGGGPFYFVDPVYQGGASESSNNLAAWAASSGASAYIVNYYIMFTVNFTVTGATSGLPISGASVSAVDNQSGTSNAQGGSYACTTNSSGQCSFVVNENQYAAHLGSYVTTAYNSIAFTITKSGCTTNNFSQSITAPQTGVSKTLGGC